MLNSTARGVPRFSIKIDRRSLSKRFSSFPKLERACSAETTSLSFFAGFAILNSPVPLFEVYSSFSPSSNHLSLPLPRTKFHGNGQLSFFYPFAQLFRTIFPAKLSCSRSREQIFLRQSTLSRARSCASYFYGQTAPVISAELILAKSSQKSCQFSPHR